MRLASTLAILGLAVLLLLAPACAITGKDVSDITVKTDGDPKVDLKGFKTYAWAAAGSAVNDPNREWTVPDFDIGAEIVAATNRELRAKGMSETSRVPDALVFFGVGIDMEAMELTRDDGIEYLKETPKGGILIVLADARSGEAVWVGSAEGKLSDNPPRELVKKRIDYAVAKIFKQFRR